ncbi:Carboxypeptidase A4 [Lunasporangiospora selenospora]|uniref:Carboxypeptidase A4 n=1 Tax=Lunasporangiospora selenospora TaxID=979761 RepID=A0A9P6FWV6_9FUNG|nr:Carboxypeptidase A4 [Lunasporangiospora selenospora]
MRQLLTTAPLLLTLTAVACLAFPSPQQGWQPQQQHAFVPGHVSPSVHEMETADPLPGYARFDQHSVLRLEISTHDQLRQLEAYVEEKNLDLWSNLRIGTVDIRVPSTELISFHNDIRVPYTVMIKNVQDLMPSSESLLTAQGGDNRPWNFTDNSFWQGYHDLTTLNNFTETLVKEYPHLVKRVSLGHTYEGREVFGMSIHGYEQQEPGDGDNDDNGGHDDDDSDDDSDDDNDNKKDEKKKNKKKNKEKKEKKEKGELHRWVKKARSWWSWLVDFVEEDGHKTGSFQTSPPGPITKKPTRPKRHPKTILIHGGQHAREWIGPAVVSYIAKELIVGYGTNKKVTKLVNTFEFTIIPVLNADGYTYTREHNRMWRKNREPTSLSFCKGVDTNRNWGYMWNQGGSSGNPCSEAYHGPKAFSSKEPRMVADYIEARNKRGEEEDRIAQEYDSKYLSEAKKNKKKKDSDKYSGAGVVAYIDFHAYSQLWMTPFGSDCKSIPKDDEDLMEGGLVAAKALKDVHGTKFAVGGVCKIIYQASGGSLDWTYAEGGVKYSYAVELRDTGRHGFMLPEKEIIPSSEETYSAFIHLTDFIRKREKQWRR